MLALDSATLGWSNGLIRSARPATAVAYSQSRNCAPSGPETLVPDALAGSSTPGGFSVTRCVSAASVKPGAVVDSTTTGSRPLPSLPVDSATSCSAQSPKPTMPEPASASASLSWPDTAPPPRAAPSTSAGLPASRDSDGSSAAASSSSCSTSTPASALGTSPKADSAL